ncbi:MAG: 50S ribosomal protein L25 [Flavobacteriales bacterium]|nr:50S ribosomal protein L25 [Flavobacteriales bacterium]
MNKIALAGTTRTQVGTKYAAQLRRNKQVPCVLYGGEAPVHFSVDEAALRKLVFTPELNGVELDIDGKKTLALIQQKQFQPVTDRVIHVDFLQLDESKEAQALMSVRLKGQPIGVRNGGTLSQNMRKLRVKGLPAKLPSVLELDVTDLDLNQTIHVSDLNYDGITVMERANDVVVAVKTPKKQADTAATAEGAKSDATKAEAKPAAKK